MKNIKNKLFGITILSAAVMLVLGLGTCESGHEHEWSELQVYSSANCMMKGGEGRRCEICGLEDVREIPIDPDNHNWKYTNDDPTCTSGGMTFGRCTNSSFSLYSESEYCTAYKEIPIPALGHDRKVVNATLPPTCTNIGRGLQVCVREKCSERDPVEVDIPALGHNRQTAITIAPTCLNAGESTESCIRAGCAEPDPKTAIVPATGHDLRFSEIKRSARCESAGEALWVCNGTGCKENELRIIAPRGHDWKLVGILYYCTRTSPICGAVSVLAY
jgi:hypothetical protein